ncbi:MAG: hypothetical protein HYZ42_03270 [Bacteroidetes bacterium]|nr:hypothetical protein [Bacteroidota bacterium]
MADRVIVKEILDNDGKIIGYEAYIIEIKLSNATDLSPKQIDFKNAFNGGSGTTNYSIRSQGVGVDKTKPLTILGAKRADGVNFNVTNTTHQYNINGF